MIKYFLLAASFLVFGTALSQNLEKQVLFTIDGNPVYTSEFLSVYNKNLDLVQDESQQDLDEYLEMFINYKLKINQAKALGLHENPNFQREFKGYRKQLAQKYLTNSNVTESLVKEAYQRSMEEVNAAHILLTLGPDAAPADTIKFYDRAMELRRELVNGADFNAFAKQFSEDPSVKQNGGELGWFNAFKMVYPFESGAYNTPVGEISMPIRTNFGYHLIKVNDRREKINVAHIMIAAGENDEKRIKEIYKEVQNGANFEALAKKYSEDKATASSGGALKPFSRGDLNDPDFEKMAFSLTENKNVSAPFRTKHGWHIVKLNSTYEAMKAELEKKVQNDSRSRIISDNLVGNLKKDFSIKENPEAVAFFQNYVPDEILAGRWKPENLDALSSKQLIKIKDSVITFKDFADYMVNRQRRPFRASNKSMLIKNWHDDFISESVLAYHREHLEDTNPEFAGIVKEYKEGLLIFDLMEQEIWKKAKTDSIGLRKYYDANRKKYPASIDFEETKGVVINDYQNHLEETWVERLRQSANIIVKKKTYKKIKKSLE